MSSVDTLAPALSRDCLVSGDAIDVLDTIRVRHCALALWQRPAPAIVATLDLDSVDDISLVLDARDGTLTARVALHAAGYPDAAATVVADDLTLLAAAFRRLAGSTAVAIRLDVVDTDACRRFHADYVSLRMLCTYRGAGTQWCRAASPDAVHTLATGTVGVFKGRLAMEEPAILHRSPPLRADGAQRLLLVVDPA
jgi:hypothetical protein